MTHEHWRAFFITLFAVVIVGLWGGFAAFEHRYGGGGWQFQLFVWALVVGVTLNGVAIVYHMTRPHMTAKGVPE